jgi:hypothetical protein
MATLVKKVRTASNPRRSKSSRPTAAPRKGSKMAKAKTKKNGTKKAAKRKNPSPVSGLRKKNRRRNPSGITAILGSPKDIMVTGVAGLISAVATRQLPQLLLTTANTGIEGYAANLVTALLATWGAGMFAGPKAAWGALTGGMVILLDRVLTEQVSPIGPYLALSGVGDATAMSNMGTIRQGYYTHPGLVDASGNLIAPQPYSDAAVAAVVARYPQLAAPIMAATQGKMGAVNPSSLRRHVASGQLLSSRFQGRFNQAQN